MPRVVSHGRTSATTSSISSSVVAAALTARWWTRKKSSARGRSVRAIRSSHRLSWSPSRARVSSSSSSSCSASRDAVSPSRSVSSTARTKKAHSGQDVGHGLADEHPLRVEPVRAPGGGGVGEDERLPADPGRGVGEVDDVERPGAEHLFAERQRGVAPRALGVLPGEAASGHRRPVRPRSRRRGRGGGSPRRSPRAARRPRRTAARRRCRAGAARRRCPAPRGAPGRATRHTSRRRGPPTARCRRCLRGGSSR